MRNEVLKKYEYLESLRNALMERLEGVEPDRLQVPPSPGKWSPAQIMDHLASAEGRSLEYIRKKTQAPDSIPPANFMCAVRTFALTFALASPFKFKAPDVVSDVPDNPPAAEVIEKWNQVRSDLKAMIESLPEDVMVRALFRHPVAGRMNMSQTLDFMISHLKRHRQQLDRALA